ncbi:hypothetical protein [Nibribacter koreensis]|uniref:Uncharacterized protein n=1 Tax=Nibribacter koreensis TaxID=1084519 RepID=A0ABP8FCZ2_9BACT
MNEEFDLVNENKAMPYQVPAGFFEGITQATLQEAKRREALTTTKSKTIWGGYSWAVAASLALLLVAGYYLLKKPQPSPPALVRTEVKPAPAATPVERNEPVTSVSVTQEKYVAVNKEEAKTQAKGQKQTRAAVPDPTPKPEKAESLDKFLAALTDQELAELAAMAASETYVYEESLLP